MKRNNKDFFPVGFWNYTAAGYVKDVRAGGGGLEDPGDERGDEQRLQR